MRKLPIQVVMVFLCCTYLVSCSPGKNSQAQSNTTNSAKGLKDYYKNYFPIGVAVSPRSLKTDEAQLILKEFNSITPENAMKMGPIHPTGK